MAYNAMLMTDFYKLTHMQQYDQRITKMVSYLTPRGSRLKGDGIDKVMMFGLERFCRKYLVQIFNKDFFDRPFYTIRNEYLKVMGKGLGYPEDQILATVDGKVKALHNLGYLPIKIRGLTEGTLVPMQCPCIEISTTKEGFYWVGQAIESLLSCSIWYPMTSATIAYEYAKIAQKAYKQTCPDKDYRTGMCDFSMRGQKSHESAVASAAAWLTAFYNSSTVDARDYLEEAYWVSDDDRIGGLTSTEHSVMCSDALLNGGDERATYKRLLTEVYPNTSFAAVCDSYDFWNVVTNILPSLKAEIMAHEGFIGIRHDSDEPVHALCGIPELEYEMPIEPETLKEIREDDDAFDAFVTDTFFDNFMMHEIVEDYGYNFNQSGRGKFYITVVDSNTQEKVGAVFMLEQIHEDERGNCTGYDYEYLDQIILTIWDREKKPKDAGLVETLYKEFGGTVNEAGYIELNPHVKAVYGDSITIPRARRIYQQLAAKGFAACNVSLGVGSFSMQAIETAEGTLAPFTRDTFSIAIKATYLEYKENGEIKKLNVFKDPKGCAGKKSIKGLVAINYNDNGELEWNDEAPDMENCDAYVTYYNGTAEGVVTKIEYLDKIRDRVAAQVDEAIK